jgi:hypothetical protein
MAFSGNRKRKKARRAPHRRPKPTILLVCEGSKTEPEYFRGLASHCKNPLVRIKICPEHGVPLTLVEIAKQYKKDAEREAKRKRDVNLRINAVWCVFDVDDHPHLEEALTTARDNGIRIALSNPSFELWLLLHFRDDPGMKPRDQIQALLRSHVSEYDKSVEYGTYSAGHAEAVKRATRMHERAQLDGEDGRNPCTTVYLLTRCISAESA